MGRETHENTPDPPSDEARIDDGPIGLVLIHGIGSQKQGEFSDLVLRGLSRAYEKPELDPHAREHCLDDRDVRVYEAWWADVLQGEAVRDSFDRWNVQSVAWFPWLNVRARLLRGRSRVSPVIWSIILAPVALMLQVGLTVARRSAFIASYLDEKAADVFNYVDSADGAVDATLPRAGAARCAEQRFVAALEQARRDGCAEIQVIAHSLGSVIAYRVLAGLHDGVPASDAGRLVTRLYTLGSPLEKVALVWPGLVPIGDARKSAMRWDNFDDPLDPIGGRIRRFDAWCRVENHRVAGRGGLRTAHRSYMSHPAFVRVISKGVTGTARGVKVSLRERLERRVLSLVESVVVLFALPLLVLLGVLATLAYTAAAIALALLAITVGVLLDGWTLWILDGPPWQELLDIGLAVFAVVMVGAFIVGPVAIGRRRAQVRHYRHRFGEPPASVASDTWTPSGRVAATIVAACAIGSIASARELGLHSVLALVYVTFGAIVLTLSLLAAGPSLWQQRRALTRALRTPPARTST